MTNFNQQRDGLKDDLHLMEIGWWSSTKRNKQRSLMSCRGKKTTQSNISKGGMSHQTPLKGSPTPFYNKGGPSFNNYAQNLERKRERKKTHKIVGPINNTKVDKPLGGKT